MSNETTDKNALPACGGGGTDNLMTDEAALFEASREVHAPSVIHVARGTEDDAGFLALPDRMRLFDVKAWLDARRPVPERVRGTAKLLTMGAFLAHVDRFHDEGTAIFADPTPRAPSLTAVYDYHQGPGSARWGQHRASFAFPLSAEWKAWQEVDGKLMDQAAFAAFIEAHAHEIAPTSDPVAQAAAARLTRIDLKVSGPSEVLTASRGISLSVDRVVENHVRLDTGEVRLVFDEKLRGEKGAALTVPASFVVGVPIFDGDPDAVALPVRLRLRVNDGKVTWSFALLGADEVLREALKDAVQRVREVSGVPVFEGAPEA